MRAIVALIAFLFFSLVFPKQAFANLLLNSSFEEASSSAPLSWAKNVSTATLGISSTAKTGTVSASINKTNGTTGLIYLYQDVDIEPEAFYSISGYAVKNSANFSWVILRISWRSSSGEISKTDSSQLTSDSSDFQLLKIDSAQTPSQAIKARIELAANIATANPSNPALFDDIDFSQIPAPDQPTPTLAPTSTPTQPPPTPTKIPTPTLTLKLTVSPTPEEVLPTDEVLGESTESGGAVSPTDIKSPSENTLISKKPKNTNSNWFQKILIFIGVVFIAACGILTFREIKKRKLSKDEEE